MAKVLVVPRKKLILYTGIAVMFLAAILYWNRDDILPAAGHMPGERVVHLVTGELKSTLPDGKTIEAYRWDPGTVFVNKGEKVKLIIYGVNGESHPFIIEGLNVKGEVKKGKETVVHFNANKEGIYRIICLTHFDAAHSGPMIGYIVVD